MANFKYLVNHKYFDVLNFETAYFLGILAADGNVSQNRITLGVCEKDREIVDNFKNAIQSTHPIKQRITRLREKSYPQQVFRFNSPHMCKTLETYGIIPNKSLTLKFPNIPPSLISSFVRGYFDGDGSITITKHKNMFIYILGTERFLKNIKDYYNQLCNTNVGWVTRHDKSKIFHFCIHGNNGGKCFSDWIYHNSKQNTRLKRKYVKMTSFDVTF